MANLLCFLLIDFFVIVVSAIIICFMIGGPAGYFLGIICIISLLGISSSARYILDGKIKQFFNMSFFYYAFPTMINFMSCLVYFFSFWDRDTLGRKSPYSFLIVATLQLISTSIGLYLCQKSNKKLIIGKGYWILSLSQIAFQIPLLIIYILSGGVLFVFSLLYTIIESSKNFSISISEFLKNILLDQFLRPVLEFIIFILLDLKLRKSGLYILGNVILYAYLLWTAIDTIKKIMRDKGVSFLYFIYSCISVIICVKIIN